MASSIGNSKGRDKAGAKVTSAGASDERRGRQSDARGESRDAVSDATPEDRRAARQANSANAVAPAGRGRTDTADAFMPDPEDGPALIRDDLAEVLAEDFLRSATSGEDVDDEVMEQVVAEEFGGPFVESSADEEFAEGTDESNPVETVPEPLPRAVHGLSTRSRP
jgi:hypothetical protein